MIVSGPDGIAPLKHVYIHLSGGQDSSFIQLLGDSYILRSEINTLSQYIVSFSLLDWAWHEILRAITGEKFLGKVIFTQKDT